MTDVYTELLQEKSELQTKVFRLEQENKELKNRNVELQITLNEFDRFNNYRSALEKIKAEADKFDYWSNNLTDASNVINSIKDKINEVLNEQI